MTKKEQLKKSSPMWKDNEKSFVRKVWHRSSSFRYLKGSLKYNSTSPFLVCLVYPVSLYSIQCLALKRHLISVDGLNEWILHFPLLVFSSWFWYLSFLLKCDLSSWVSKITFYGSWHARGLLFLCLTCRSELDHGVVTLTDAYGIEFNEINPSGEGLTVWSRIPAY